MRLNLMLRACQFHFRDSIGDQAVQLVINAGFNLFGGMLPTAFRTNVKQCGVLRFAVVCRYERYSLIALYQSLVQPGRFSFAKNDAEDLERITVRRSNGRSMIGNRDAWDLGAPAYYDSLYAVLFGFDDVDWNRWNTCGDTAKPLRDVIQNPFRFEVTGKRQNRVIGLIVLSVIRLLLFGRGALDVLKPADDRISIRMNLVCCGVDFLDQ